MSLFSWFFFFHLRLYLYRLPNFFPIIIGLLRWLWSFHLLFHFRLRLLISSRVIDAVTIFFFPVKWLSLVFIESSNCRNIIMINIMIIIAWIMRYVILVMQPGPIYAYIQRNNKTIIKIVTAIYRWQRRRK